ncbi:MAG TPA: hypothetical protein VML75_25245 [Kofleriaceae bacterium]|nr:hypothetical protein [Kofleriaceae bacterium]
MSAGYDRGMRRALARRAPTRVDPVRAVAIKRNVHEAVVATSAELLARAMRQVMADPDRRFDLIRVRRDPDRVGAAFEVGERFLGSVGLDLALATRAPRLARALQRPAVAPILAWLECRVASDYAVVTELDHTARADGSYRVTYRYLTGAPLIGTSSLEIAPAGTLRCRLTHVFEYQETGWLGIGVLHGFGIQRHDAAFAAQVGAAAEQAGAAVLSISVPSSTRD